MKQVLCDHSNGLSGSKNADSLTVRYASLIAEYSIYIYLFSLFFDAGEGIRNTGLYGAFAAWLILILNKRIAVSMNIISWGFSAYIASALLSSFFSLDPAYSLVSLKSDILPSVIIFCIISTYFNNRMIFKTVDVFCFAGFVFLSLGLHTFLSGKSELYTSDNLFLSAKKNNYGFIIAFIVPFYFLKFFKTPYGWKKWLWAATSVWGILGTILSASRGAVGSIITSIIIFGMAFFQKRYMRAMLIAILIFMALAVLSFDFLPETVKSIYMLMPEHLSNFNERTYLFWEPAMDAVKKRPVLGWGYGKNIYRDPRPFENGLKPEWKNKGGLHNTFLSILFHQGILGLVSYTFLFSTSLFVLIKKAGTETYELRLLALSLISILVGPFFVDSLVKNVAFRSLAPILAMSAVLCKRQTNEHHME